MKGLPEPFTVVFLEGPNAGIVVRGVIGTVEISNYRIVRNGNGVCLLMFDPGKIAMVKNPNQK